MSLKLIQSVAKNSDSFFELSESDKHFVIQQSIVNGDFSALEGVANLFTGIYDYDEHNPYWLESEFTDPIWQIKIPYKSDFIEKTINWESVILDDGEKLTNKKHKALLNAFKYWVTATDNPLQNGGKLLKPESVYQSINYVVSLVNAILLQGKKIRLAENHLKALNDDLFMSILINISEGSNENGIYNFHNEVRSLLLSKVHYFDDKKYQDFLLKYPYINRNIDTEDAVLGLTIDERIKACCWLNELGFYKEGGNKNGIYPTGNNNFLKNYIYKNRVLSIDGLVFRNLVELNLKQDRSITEFSAIPNADRSALISESLVENYIRTFKFLRVSGDNDCINGVSNLSLRHLTLSRVKEHTRLKKTGRFKTLPPKLVFSLIKSTYEYVFQYQSYILNSVLNVLIVGKQKSSKHLRIYEKSQYKGTICERLEWSKAEALTLIDRELIDLGVKVLSVSSMDGDQFENIRSNYGLFDLYNVLMGSIQILLGSLMARRVDELISLKSSGNLYPNIDPSSEKGKKTDYLLKFKVKKTGNGGQYATNEEIKRPLPRSIALIIWNLEKFNQRVINAGINKGKLSLFNNLTISNYCLTKIQSNSFNTHLDIACDYFETPLVQFDNGELRRYYVRQHQLRRFFAMVFFWSRSFDGLDTLRWMLGHADVEHLYHYISENEPGSVLKGIKASYLVDAVQNRTLQDIDTLRSVIAKRYGVKEANISLSPLSDAIDDYDDDFQTIPTIDDLKKKELLESQVLDLLEEDIITLEPEFFTVERNGETIQDFNLTLQVKETN